MKETDKIYRTHGIGKYKFCTYRLTAAWSVLPYIGIKVSPMPDDCQPYLCHPCTRVSVGWGRWYVGIGIWDPNISKFCYQQR